MVSVRMFSSLLSIMPGVSCIKWWPLIQVIIWNVFVKLGHNHPNHHKSDTRDCSSPGLGIIKSIEFNSFRLLSIRLIVRHSGGRMQIIIDTNTNQTTGLSNSVLIDINARHQKKRIPFIIPHRLLTEV